MSKQSYLMEDAREKIDVAITYAEDGAFFTAADRLEAAAKLVRQHAENCRFAEREQ